MITTARSAALKTEYLVAFDIMGLVQIDDISFSNDTGIKPGGEYEYTKKAKIFSYMVSGTEDLTYTMIFFILSGQYLNGLMGKNCTFAGSEYSGGFKKSLMPCLLMV